MKYLIRLEVQEEITSFDQRRLAKFILETAPGAPFRFTVTKVEVEDQQTGRIESVGRGES